VVSDGHGSARHFRSQIGSSLAVSTVAATLQSFLRESVASNGQVPFVPEQVHELERKIVSGWLAAVHSDLEQNPFSEAELATLEKEEGAEGRAAVESLPELAYGATLLAAAATDSLLLYLQLGDGEILSVTANGTTTRPLPPDDRLIANQTTSLCQPEAWKDFRSSWVTDGALPSMVTQIRSDPTRIFSRSGRTIWRLSASRGLLLWPRSCPPSSPRLRSKGAATISPWPFCRTIRAQRQGPR
jgi:hypothetical protein